MRGQASAGSSFRGRISGCPTGRRCRSAARGRSARTARAASRASVRQGSGPRSARPVLFDLAGNASQILIAAETGHAPTRQSGLAELLGAAAGNSTAKVAEQYLGELLARGTRFRVDAGTRMNVLVEEDMHLPAQPVRGDWR